MKSKGKLFLIPNTLGLSSIENSIPTAVSEAINEIDTFITENGKEARRLLKMLKIQKDFSSLTFFELNKHTPEEDVTSFIQPLLNGKNTGVISDAGCPGVADPGAEIVRLAHENRIQVIPMVGPSSITLALMASGFNGQQFVFHGYLPKDRKARIFEIRKIEKETQKSGQSQIFIETPYRNNHLIEDIVSTCNPNTQFCIAANLTHSNERIISGSVQDWKKINTNFHKMPAVFLLYSNKNKR